jgi:hypothetical protein
MKKTIALIIFSLTFFTQAKSQYLRKDNMQNFVYFFDNGFEKIDLTQTLEITRAFFTRGTPHLFMVTKNAGYNESKRNLVQSYTAFVRDENNQNLKVFTMKNPLLTKDFQTYIFGCKPGSSIMFSEVKLTIVEPGVNPEKTIKPAAFYIYLK